MKVRFIFAWYDLWIGAYWDRRNRRLYILPLPTIGIVIQFRQTCEQLGHEWISCGGRPCPKNLTTECSQTVYACRRCGAVDYGEPGGPGAMECERECLFGHEE
jgi:hypothetical protein